MFCLWFFCNIDSDCCNSVVSQFGVNKVSTTIYNNIIYFEKILLVLNFKASLFQNSNVLLSFPLLLLILSARLMSISYKRCGAFLVLLLC